MSKNARSATRETLDFSAEKESLISSAEIRDLLDTWRSSSSHHPHPKLSLKHVVGSPSDLTFDAPARRFVETSSSPRLPHGFPVGPQTRVTPSRLSYRSTKGTSNRT